MESDLVKKYISFGAQKTSAQKTSAQKTSALKNLDELLDYNIFIESWKKYIDMRYTDDQKVIYARANQNLIARSRFHYQYFSENRPNVSGVGIIGESGYSSCIMAFDALLDSHDIWEKLIIYTVCHYGDSDTVAAIAAGWFGALYGFQNVPPSNLKYLEFKNELEELAKLIYEKSN